MKISIIKKIRHQKARAQHQDQISLAKFLEPATRTCYV